MQLRHLSVTNFKNVESVELEPSANLTCIVGDNGEGKTNFLDAIYMLSMCKSSIGTTDKQCITHGQDFFLLKGDYTKNDADERISYGFSREQGKRLNRNGKSYDKISEHVGLLPLVMVSPADGALISDASDERRKYMNRVLVQTDGGYLACINHYGALLLSRNKVLKSYEGKRKARAGGYGANADAAENDDMLDALDGQLILRANEVYAARKRLAEQLQEPFQRYYAAISGNGETVALKYASDLDGDDMATLLRDNRLKDIALQFTSVGIQRDDLRIVLGGYAARRSASQGQQKSILLALKFAQSDIIKARYAFPPFMLLDDIFDKLDGRRIENLITLIGTGDLGQTFLTDTNKDRVNMLLAGFGYESKVVEMREGAIA